MQFRRSLAPVLIAASGLTLSSPLLLAQTPASTEEALRQRVGELEQKLRRLEERLEQQAQQPAPQVPAAPPAAASEPTAREQVLQERVDELDQQVKILGRKQELEREAAAAKAKETPTVIAGREGFGLGSADGAFQLRLRGYLQADARFFEDDSPAINPSSDPYLLRRVRPIIEATLLKKYTIRFMPDFGGGTATIQDAYIDANFNPVFKLRAGKFKPPVGLERLQSGASLEFVERAFPTNLVPNRDIGIQAFGEFFTGAPGYELGVFNGVVDGGSGDSDNNENKDVAARIFAHPFKNTASDALRGLGVGFAYTTGNQRSSPPTGNLPSYRTPGQQVFFTYNTGAIASGTRERFAPQAYWYSGPFGALGEFVLSRQEVARGTNQLEAESRAWQVALYWVPTGEDASFRGITPRTSFDPANGTWGALELVARYSEQTVADEVFAGPAATRLADPTRSAHKATDIGLGANWYWNRNVKIQLTYDRTRFKGGAATGDRPDENVLFGRLQLSF